MYSRHQSPRSQYAADFVDLSRPEAPALVTPGIDTVDSRVRRGAAGSTARQLLHRAFQELGEPHVSAATNFHGVLSVYEGLAESTTMQDATPLVGIDDTDLMFILPILSDVDFQKIECQVAGALIYGPTLLTDDLQAVRENPNAWEFFVSRLGNKMLECGMATSNFDAWLTRVREHKFLQLVENGGKLQDRQREEAAQLAQQMYCTLLWLSYRMMAHCYGALMFLVYLDFCESDQRPSELEKWFFRLTTAQVNYLGGLPLDFLERAPLRWIIPTLDRCGPYWDPPHFEGLSGLNEYQKIPQLLGLFGALVRQRREVDRRTKAGRAAGYREVQGHP